MSAPPRLKVGALFAGYGGLELGVSQVLDVETSWVAEFDKAPSRILAQRFPGVPNLGDVTAVNWAAVEPVDIITGGSPCQDLSHAGKRRGMRPGTRSGLWASMCDAVDIIRPRLVLWENVRGALSAPATTGQLESCDLCMGDEHADPMRALGRVLGDLAELGYDAAWTGLRAADIGAPHGRYRIFVLAWPAGHAADIEQQRHRGPDEPASPGPAGGADGAVADTDSTARDQRRDAAPGQTPGGWSRPDTRGRDRAPDVDLLPTPLTTESGDAGWYGTGGPNLRTVIAELELLPTPAVNDMGARYEPDSWDEWTARTAAKHHNGNGHGKSLSIEARRLLPTPTAQAAKHTDDDRGPGSLDDGNLWSVAARLTPDTLKLLPTPDVSSGERSPESHASGEHQVSLMDLPHLLPTPSAADATGGHVTRSGARSGELLLPGLAPLLMPTPTAVTRDRSEEEITHRRATRNKGLNLDEVRPVEFGAYTPAVTRWENILGRPAPPPTQPDGRDGRHRLSARFVEWLMGLPAGWVTDTGLSRNEQLHALGNGVVPQQAAAALRHLLRLRATLTAPQEATACP